jgi:hypothetical protein
MPLDELNDAVLERMYPAELIVQNNYFLHYVTDGYFSWYFDSDLCYKKYLSDYQRLVLFNDNVSICVVFATLISTHAVGN